MYFSSKLFSFLKNYVYQNRVIILICVLLSAIPFFWFKLGEIDIGGDGGRLYFYDPVNQIKNIALYYVSPSGIGVSEASFYYLPFFAILALLKHIGISSSVLIALNNAIKISVGFFAVYAILRELIGTRSNKYFIGLASILSGFFYIFNPLCYQFLQVSS